MATATLVHQGAHRLRYLIAAEGSGSETVSISTIGSATPDLLTDSLGPGVIKKLAKVVADGYGTFAAGAQTQAKARALWLSNLVGADPSVGSPNGSKLPTARCFITRRTPIGHWSIDANVDTGNPIIAVTIAGGGTTGAIAYLDVEAPGTIGV